MPLATVEDVAARIGRPVLDDENSRISAFLADVTGLVEDYCGRELDRREDQALTLYAEGGCRLLVPSRYLTFFSPSSVLVDGAEVTADWSFNGRQLVLTDGVSVWPEGPVTVVASWGYPVPPATLRAVACSEVVRWLALSPGVERERVGEVEVEFAGAGSAQALSSTTRSALASYRRRGIGSLTLRKVAPCPEVGGPDVYGL